MTYTAQPGTIPHRAIEYLRSLPEGTAVPSAALAEALDITCTDVVAFLAAARRRGALVASRIAGRGNALQWSLGTGIALDLEADEKLAPRDPNPRPDPALRSVFDFAQIGQADVAHSAFERAYADALVGGLGVVKMEHVPADEVRLAPDAVGVAVEPAPEQPAAELHETEAAPSDAEAPAQRHPDDVASDPEGVLIIRPGEPLRSAPWPEQAAPPDPKAQPQSEPPPAYVDHPPDDDDTPMPRVALWDTGELTIVRGLQTIEFTAGEARHIYRYLNRVLVGGYPS